jgi:acetyl-CoA carboxylase biotin carboxyl carrier protein
MTDDGIATRARALAGALTAGGFARLRVREGDTEIELRRAPQGQGAPLHAPAAAAEGERTVERSAVIRPADLVTSDVVGVVRLSRPAPVEGQEIEGDRELAFVETLGIRNPVRSRGAGRLSAVLVTDGQPVEYGQPLFAIER